MVPGRRLEDNAHILLSDDNGARGAMWVSAVAAGEQVGLRLRVYGEKGHIAWEQSDLTSSSLPCKARRRARSCVARAVCHPPPSARRASRPVRRRVFEAFATLYGDYADILAARQEGAAPDSLALWAPMVEDGARGIAFVEVALSSHAEGGRWLDFQPEIEQRLTSGADHETNEQRPSSWLRPPHLSAHFASTACLDVRKDYEIDGVVDCESGEETAINLDPRRSSIVDRLKARCSPASMLRRSALAIRGSEKFEGSL